MTKNKKRKYVIQEHDATNLHWDLRLEMDGVLKSWAVPKSPSALEKKGIKRLAIQVSDHDLDYRDFEGEIKEGYGKGTVKIWDFGDYELIGKDENKIEFKINGKKLSGKYILIKTNYGNSSEQKKKSWLFFKVE